MRWLASFEQKNWRLWKKTLVSYEILWVFVQLSFDKIVLKKPGLLPECTRQTVSGSFPWKAWEHCRWDRVWSCSSVTCCFCKVPGTWLARWWTRCRLSMTWCTRCSNSTGPSQQPVIHKQFITNKIRVAIYMELKKKCYLKVWAGDALCELVEQRHHDLLELGGLDDV